MVTLVRISIASSFVVSCGGSCSPGALTVLRVFEVAGLVAVGAIVAMF